MTLPKPDVVDGVELDTDVVDDDADGICCDALSYASYASAAADVVVVVVDDDGAVVEADVGSDAADGIDGDVVG